MSTCGSNSERRNQSTANHACSTPAGSWVWQFTLCHVPGLCCREVKPTVYAGGIVSPMEQSVCPLGVLLRVSLNQGPWSFPSAVWKLSLNDFLSPEVQFLMTAWENWILKQWRHSYSTCKSTKRFTVPLGEDPLFLRSSGQQLQVSDVLWEASPGPSSCSQALPRCGLHLISDFPLECPSSHERPIISCLLFSLPLLFFPPSMFSLSSFLPLFKYCVTQVSTSILSSMEFYLNPKLSWFSLCWVLSLLLSHRWSWLSPVIDLRPSWSVVSGWCCLHLSVFIEAALCWKWFASSVPLLFLFLLYC